MNVVTYESAEAVTLDGRQWDLYASNAALIQETDKGKKIQTSDIRYGSWTLGKSLKRGAIHPSADFRRLERYCEVILGHLPRLQEKLPFLLADNIELWLLDEKAMPLALLNSCIDESDVELDLLIDWRAGNRCKAGFNPDVTLFPPGQAADYLTCYINDRAGGSPSAQWFYRDKDGKGRGNLGGVNLDPELNKRNLPSSAFPTIQLNTEDHDHDHTQLVQDFIDWQAAWLLLLPDLDSTTRRYFEGCSRQQASVVADQYHLYPEIINEEAVNSARIEAMMRENRPEDKEEEEEEEDMLSAFYNEVGATNG